MTKDTRDSWVLAGKILAVLGGLIGVVAAIRAGGDERYVTRKEYETEQVADSAWKATQAEQLRYVACRQDFARVDCLSVKVKP